MSDITQAAIDDAFAAAFADVHQAKWNMQSVTLPSEEKLEFFTVTASTINGAIRAVKAHMRPDDGIIWRMQPELSFDPYSKDAVIRMRFRSAQPYVVAFVASTYEANAAFQAARSGEEIAA